MKKITMVDCSKQRLCETYLVVYAIKNEVNIKKGDYIDPSYIYTLVGINQKGIRQLINVYQDRVNNNRFWLDNFEGLKARGLKNILFLSVDDNKNLKRCAKVAFPTVTFADSVTDIIPKFYKYSLDRDQKKVSRRLYSLYTQNSLEEFKNIFTEFSQTYNNAIQKKLIEKYLNNIENIYKMSVNIRKLIFKHSANMYLYDKIRLTFNQNKSYIESTDEILEKIGSINEYFGFTSFKKNEWAAMLNDLIELYPEIDFI